MLVGIVVNALVGKALSRDLVTFFEKSFGFIERNRSDNDVRLLDRISRLIPGERQSACFSVVSVSPIRLRVTVSVALIGAKKLRERTVKPSFYSVNSSGS